MADGYELCSAQSAAYRRGVVLNALQVQAPGWDLGELTRRLEAVVAGHEILRTSFTVPTGATEPLQVVAGSACPTVDPAGAAVPTGVDLSSPTPLRVIPDSVRPGDAFVLCASELVADHLSLELVAELLLDRRLPEPDPVQVADLAGWEREQLDLDGPERRAADRWWEQRSPRRAALPAGPWNRPATAPPRRVRVDRPTDLPDAVWAAAWRVVLQRDEVLHDGDTRLAFTVTGRYDSELTSAVGPLRRWVGTDTAVDPDVAFVESIEAVGHDLNQAGRYALHAPEAAAAAALSFHPVGAVAPTPLAGPVAELQVFGARSAEVVAADRGPLTAGLLAAHLGAVLDAFAADATTAPADIDVVGADEVRRLRAVQDGGAVTGLDPATTVVSAHRAAAARRPAASAVSDGSTTLDQAELDRLSDRLAERLSDRLQGVGPGAVAVVVDRTVGSLVTLLAVSKAGRAFQPVDAASPPARRHAQVAAGRCVLTICVPELAEDGPPAFPSVDVVAGVVAAVPDVAVPMVRLAELRADVAGSTAVDLGPGPGADEICYQISTSGSTGVPKVVAVRHRNAVAYAAAVVERLALGEHDVLGVITSLSTDLAYTMVLPALLTGAAIRLFAEDEIGSLPALLAASAPAGVTALKMTPSHLRALLVDPVTRLEIPLVVLGGESLDASTVVELRERGVERVINHYGPTETTVGAVTCEVTGVSRTDVVPIGRALPGVRTHVVDDRSRPVSWGVRGQLAVAGVGVAAGYVADSETTAARFVTIPGEAQPVYLTGDLVRIDDAGNLVFLGRQDGQVKIRGFRVELDEVASTLRSHPAVTEAVAVVDPGDAAADRIVVYVTVSGPAPVPTWEPALIAFAASLLPAHMVPTRVVVLTAFPRTASGKIDRRDLADRVVPDTSGPVVQSPVGATESALLEIWSDVLGLGRLGVTDDFFLVGGHSLLATRIMARTRAQFGVELPLHLIFSHTTVRALAAEIDARTPVAVPAGTATDDELAAAVDAMSDAEVARLLDQLGGTLDREP